MSGRVAFGIKLREYRRKKRLTIIEVAHRVGIHHSYLGKLEKALLDRGPSLQVIYRLAEVLDADAGELLRLLGKVDPERMGDELVRLRARVDQLERKVRELGGTP